jgi:multicomponent Na+:H+ antiporter subunit D
MAVAWAICLPLAGAVVAVFATRRAVTMVGLISSAVTTMAAIQVGWQVFRDGPFDHAAGAWISPLGIVLRADGLSGFMLLMTALVGVFISLYAAAYFTDTAGSARSRPRFRWTQAGGFWPLWLFLWASLNGLFLSADVFNIYVALELVTLAGIGLIILTGERVALVAGMRYLFAAFLGSLVYLLGVALLYAGWDALDIRMLGARISPGPAALAALALTTSGLMLKTAVFPLHFWLPAAHANAAAPVSAILSAIVIKASFYLIARLWFELFPAVVTLDAGQLIGVLGAGAILWGSVQAIRQHRLKLLIAYSTVAHVGYLVLLIPLALPMTPVMGDAAGWRLDAWTGGLLHALAHALAKASMFAAAGVMMHAVGSDRLESLQGVAGQLPIPVFAFGLAGMSLAGLPPSGGFAAKWLMMRAAIMGDQWWWAAVLLAGGLLTAGYVFVVMGFALSRPESPTPLRPLPRRGLMEATALALALLALLLGVRTTEPLDLLKVGNPFE